VTEDTAGGNVVVVVVDRRARLESACDFSIPQFPSVESPVQLDGDCGLPHRYGIGKPPVRVQ